MCDNWTDSYDSQRITNFDWNPYIFMNRNEMVTRVPCYMAKMYDSSYQYICSNLLPCTRDIEDETWKSGETNFLRDMAKEMIITGGEDFINFPDYVELGKRDNDDPLWTGGLTLRLNPLQPPSYSNNHYEAIYSGTHDGPLFTLKFIADFSPLSQSYTLEFNVDQA